MIAAAFGGVIVPLTLEKLGLIRRFRGLRDHGDGRVGYFSFPSFATLYFGLREMSGC